MPRVRYSLPLPTYNRRRPRGGTGANMPPDEAWGVESYADAEARHAAEAAAKDGADDPAEPVEVKRDGEGDPDPNGRAEPADGDTAADKRERSDAARKLAELSKRARARKRAAGDGSTSRSRGGDGAPAGK